MRCALLCPGEPTLQLNQRGKGETTKMLKDSNNHYIEKLRSSPIIQQLQAEGRLNAIEAALQGGVYTFINKHKGDGSCFALRDMFGDKNWEWEKTPLYPIWEKCLASKKGDKDSAYKYAARIAGFILKNVLINDRRTFKQGSGFGTQCYSWVGGE